MSAINIPAIAASILVILGLYKLIIYPAFLSPLAKIPAAHWTAKFCPLWSYYIRYVNIENKTVYLLHKRLGPVVRTGPSELSVNCYEGGLKTIYTGGFPKTDFYPNRFNNYGHENLFTMTDSKAHSVRKRMLSNIYSKSAILSSLTVRATAQVIIFERLFPIFQESSNTETPVDVHKLNYAYAMDTFSAYQFGLSLGSNFIQDIQQREWYLKHFFSQRPYVFWTTELPGLTSFLQKLGIRLVPKWCNESTFVLEKWNLDICDKAEKLLSEKSVGDAANYPAVYATERAKFQDLAAKLGHSPSESSHPYPHRLDIASDMYDHNAAAHETSGDTLTWLYYEMSRRPAFQAALRKELLLLDPPLTFPLTSKTAQEMPDFKAIDALPLLDAVLHETLRLWVSVPGGQPRKTPYPSCSLAGYDDIPPNVRVQSAAFTLHRNPDVFPEPEEWKPERWMDASKEQLAEMRKWFWAFGSGGRMCIGNNFAVHSMKLAIAAIYTNFTTTIVDAEGIEQDEGFMAGPKGNKLVLQFRRV